MSEGSTSGDTLPDRCTSVTPEQSGGAGAIPALNDSLELLVRLLGAVAQLGERLHGMQEVRGATPLSSIRYLGRRTDHRSGAHSKVDGCATPREWVEGRATDLPFDVSE
jgi:hypothetical protein